MQTPLISVKFAFYLMCVIGAYAPAHAAKHLPTLHVEKTYASSLKTESSYVAQNLKFEPFDQLRTDLENRLKTKLKNRGEAHITVITPPEWKVLSQKLTINEVNEWALSDKLHLAPYRPHCVGTFKLKDDSTYFVVVESLALLQFRQKLKREFDQRHGQGDFDPDHFSPHITLGFTHKDLHEQDGAKKDDSSCWLRWK